MEYSVEIENIGGIYHGQASLSPGLNAVQASNWQGKSSLISAIKAVIGSGEPLTEGQDSGYVELDMGDETYRVEFRREDDNIIRDGNPYLTDELNLVSAELFAFFDEYNEIREAVRQGDNLEEVLLRPLDVEDIEKQIAELKRERDQVESELSRAEDAADRLPSVQERVTQLETKLDNLRAQQANIQTGTTESSEFSQKRDKLSDLRAEQNSVENQIERLDNSVERIQSELEEKRAELDDHEVPDAEDTADILESRRSELTEIEHDVELLQSIYSANKRVLEEGRLDLLTHVEREIAGDTVECWVCGSEAARSEVEQRVEHISEHITELQSEANAKRDRVNELESKLDDHREGKRKAEQLERDIEELEDKLVNRRQSLSSARERREELEKKIDDLAEEVDKLDEKVTDIESDIKIAERELTETRDELDELQTQANQRDFLKDEHERLTEEINQLKERRSTIKQQVRDTFDESIQEIVELFETGFDGAHLTGQFELVVARDGHEASLNTLSEGERELLGVIAALAGYEVFDVADVVPIMLLDEVAGLDEDNLSTLIDYLRERTEFLVFTAYPEHETLDTTIQLSEWDLVSAQPARTES